MNEGNEDRDLWSTPEFWDSSLTDRINLCRTWLQRNSSSIDYRYNYVVKILLLLEVNLENEKKMQDIQQILEIKQEMHARSLGSVRTRYPLLVDRTDSSAHHSKFHQGAKVHDFDKDVFEQYRESIEKEMGGDFWEAGLWAVPAEERINCDSEIDAVQHVMQVVNSVLRGLKLDKIVRVGQERTLAGVACNLVLIYRPKNLPFACIEVKKPGNTIDGRRGVFHGNEGELHDACKALELFGFNAYGGVVGMVATGNHWRLTSTRPLHKTPNDLVDGLTTLINRSQCSDDEDNNSPDDEQVVTISPRESEVAFKSDKDESQTAYDSDEGERVLYASRVVPDLLDDNSNVAQAGKQIIQLVVLYVLQACSTLVELLQRNSQPTQNIVIRPKMRCRILTNDEESFAFGTVQMTGPMSSHFLPKSAGVIYAIHPLGSGEYGDCYLGVSEGGTYRCVVKFFAKGQAKEELSNWNKVYGASTDVPESFTWNIAGGHACLVMPYVRPVPIEGRLGWLDNGTVQATLNHFAESGYIHGDVKWCHFGWLDLDDGNSKLIMMDLGYIMKPTKKEQITTWLEESVAFLASKAGAPEQSARLRKRKGTAEP